jgi:hypothetical protein
MYRLLMDARAARCSQLLLSGTGVEVSPLLKNALMDLFYLPRSESSKQVWVHAKFLELCATITTMLEHIPSDTEG